MKIITLNFNQIYTERKKSYEYQTKPSYEQTDTIQYAAPETSVATTELRQFICGKHNLLKS